MKKILLSLLIISVLVISVMPAVCALSIGGEAGVTIITEPFVPRVWQCDHRVIYDDGTEPGRISEDGQELVERLGDYAFEGEQIQMKVLVMDKNGIDKVSDVYMTVDGYKEANCQRLTWNPTKTLASCNSRILEEQITEFNSDLMAYYLCTLTIETPESMYDEHDITVKAESVDGGEPGVMDETEHWFLNPKISLHVDGDLIFESKDINGYVRPGTSAYSDRILVENTADTGSGVLLDMFISGTDFYDSGNSGAKCPTTNQLSLSAFRYYATNGAYSTHQDSRKDAEGYVPINYGIGFNDPKPFYGKNEIIQSNLNADGYYAGNLLAPGAEMALVFRLNLPEPCNGDFDNGKIFFWAEAV